MINKKELEDLMTVMRELGRIEGGNTQLRARIAELEAQIERERKRVDLKNDDIDGYRKMIVELEDELQQVVDYCETLTKRCVDDAAEIGRLEAQLRAGVPEGWKLVPVEPTPHMLQAACDEEQRPLPIWSRMKAIYTAMLDTAPAPAPKAQEHSFQNAICTKCGEKEWCCHPVCRQQAPQPAEVGGQAGGVG